MSERFYDQENSKVQVPSELFDYFDNLGKGKRVKKGKYKNLDQFIEDCISIFVTTTNDLNFNFEKKTLTLELEKDDGYIKFNIEINYFDLPYSFIFKVSREKNKNDCLSFTWFPFNKTIYLNSLLYDSDVKSKKIIANKECNVKNIPDKAGEFFLNMIDDIGKKLGVERIILEDASVIFMENDVKISLAMFYLKKNGTTYYGKFGYKPVTLSDYNAGIYYDIMFNLPTKSDLDELNFLKTQLKKMGDLDLISTIKEFKKLKYHLPTYFEKKL